MPSCRDKEIRRPVDVQQLAKTHLGEHQKVKPTIRQEKESLRKQINKLKVNQNGEDKIRRERDNQKCLKVTIGSIA